MNYEAIRTISMCVLTAVALTYAVRIEIVSRAQKNEQRKAVQDAENKLAKSFTKLLVQTDETEAELREQVRKLENTNRMLQQEVTRLHKIMEGTPARGVRCKL